MTGHEKDQRTGFVCGTKATVLRGITYRVVCATCGAGGTVPHDKREDANRCAVRDSDRACRSCGAS